MCMQFDPHFLQCFDLCVKGMWHTKKRIEAINNHLALPLHLFIISVLHKLE